MQYLATIRFHASISLLPANTDFDYQDPKFLYGYMCSVSVKIHLVV